MDHELFDDIDEVYTPKFNPEICNGLAVQHMKQVESYVDSLFRSAAAGFPEGLKYLGYRRCTPKEEYDEVVKKRSGNISYDIAESYLYMVKYYFSFNGEAMEKALYLPYVKDAGLIKIRGSLFSVSPILADEAISVGNNSIFIPLDGTKLTCERFGYSFYINGERETTNVVFSNIYKRSEKGKARRGKQRVNAVTTLAHYLFCKFGIYHTFRQFGGSDVIVGTSADITPEFYPTDQWLICSSTRLKPKGVKSKIYYSSDIHLAIRREDYTICSSSMIGAFFYLVDHFPERIDPESVDHIGLWREILGYIILGDDSSTGLLLNKMNTHLSWLDEYVDEQSRKRLQRSGVPCEDIYQLFAHVIETLAVMVVQAESSEASMYDKKLMILRYTLFDINKAIHMFRYALGPREKDKKPPTRNDIINAMRDRLNQDAITRINTGHGEVAGVSSPSDNKYFKITSNLVPQTSATGGRRSSKRTSLANPSKYLHVSIAVVGSYNNLPKSSPDGRTRINPCVEIDSEGNVLRDQEDADLLEAVQRKIQRK